MARPATAAVRLLSGEREPVRVATTANIDLDGLQTVDGVTLAVNDRVLVKDQTDARTNGIYTASVGIWQRASDARFPRAIAEGVTVQVQEGTVHGGQTWRFSSTPERIGVSDINLTYFLSATFTDDAVDAVNDAGAIVIAEANVAADRAEDAALDAEAARDATLNVFPMFDTLAEAEAYDAGVDTPPSVIETRGRLSVGVGGGTYVSNGTAAGDLVIASGQGYTLVQNPLNLATVADLLDDGGLTDQTGLVVAALTTLKAADFKGLITVPARTKLKPGELTPVMPPKAIFKAIIIMQSGSDTGYLQMADLTIDVPADANTDTAIMHLSGHYADFMTIVDGESGTTSGDTGLQGVSHSYGMLEQGSGGPRVMLQQNFVKSQSRATEYSNEGVWSWILRSRAPWRARRFEYWQTGLVVSIGDYILAINGRYYRATTAGTSTVEPTHTTKSTATGADGVTWQDEDGSWVNFGTILYADELGRVGNRSVPTGMTQYWKQNPEDSEGFEIYYEAAGPSKSITTRYRPTTGAAATLTNTPLFRARYDGARGALQWMDSGFNYPFMEMDDVKGLGVASLRRIQQTAVNGDTTPTVLGAGRLVISNTGATSITNFDQATVGQEVELYFTNGNTTLVHSSALYLKSLTNVTPTSGGIIVLTRDYVNSGWVEKSRNF